MDALLAYLDYVKPFLKIVFIYLQEAHADDLWPLGYGITSSKTIEDRWERCDNLMKKWPNLAEYIDKIYVDNMDDQFNSLTGAWPESYFFADKDGMCTWSSKTINDEKYKVFNVAFKDAYDRGDVKIRKDKSKS